MDGLTANLEASVSTLLFGVIPSFPPPQLMSTAVPGGAGGGAVLITGGGEITGRGAPKTKLIYIF